MSLRRGGWRGSAASLLWTALFLVLARRALAARCRRYLVAGRSMAPTLQAGDWLLVDTTAYRGRRPRIGDVVAARDPRDASRVLFKRVGRRNSRGLWLLGDNPAESTDSRRFGWVTDSEIIGRVWFRYWPVNEVAILH